MTVLPITLTISAAAALINLWLSIRVSRVRIASKVLIGDGNVPMLAARMRAHANFIEYTPMFLILLGLVELARGSATWLWLVAIVFILSRILHVFGMDRVTTNALRATGFVGTVIATLVLAGYALAMPYLTHSVVAAQHPATTAVVDR
jgi:uncharacterized membrane protein YecN with MAPEG domain